MKLLALTFTIAFLGIEMDMRQGMPSFEFGPAKAEASWSKKCRAVADARWTGRTCLVNGLYVPRSCLSSGAKSYDDCWNMSGGDFVLGSPRARRLKTSTIDKNWKAKYAKQLGKDTKHVDAYAAYNSKTNQWGWATQLPDGSIVRIPVRKGQGQIIPDAPGLVAGAKKGQTISRAFGKPASQDGEVQASRLGALVNKNTYGGKASLADANEKFDRDLATIMKGKHPVTGRKLNLSDDPAERRQQVRDVLKDTASRRGIPIKSVPEHQLNGQIDKLIDEREPKVSKLVKAGYDPSLHTADGRELTGQGDREFINDIRKDDADALAKKLASGNYKGGSLEDAEGQCQSIKNSISKMQASLKMSGRSGGAARFESGSAADELHKAMSGNSELKSVLNGGKLSGTPYSELVKSGKLKEPGLVFTVSCLTGGHCGGVCAGEGQREGNIRHKGCFAVKEGDIAKFQRESDHARARKTARSLKHENKSGELGMNAYQRGLASKKAGKKAARQVAYDRALESALKDAQKEAWADFVKRHGQSAKDAFGITLHEDEVNTQALRKMKTGGKFRMRDHYRKINKEKRAEAAEKVSKYFPDMNGDSEANLSEVKEQWMAENCKGQVNCAEEYDKFAGNDFDMQKEDSDQVDSKDSFAQKCFKGQSSSERVVVISRDLASVLTSESGKSVIGSSHEQVQAQTIGAGAAQ